MPEGCSPSDELSNQIILNGDVAVVGTLDVVAAVAVDGQVLIGRCLILLTRKSIT